jgi:hypothetical protein
MRLVSMLSKVCKSSPTAACALTVPPACWYRQPAAAGLRDPQVHGPARYWLNVQGSFTRALQQRCQQSFLVEVASEGFALPCAEEARKLNLGCWRVPLFPWPACKGQAASFATWATGHWAPTYSAIASGIEAHSKPGYARAPIAGNRGWPGVRCFTPAGRAASIR